MKKKRIKIIILVILAIILLGMFFIRVPLKTIDAISSQYDEKVSFKGVYFVPENIIYSGELKNIKLNYRDGEKVAKDAVIANGITAKEEGIFMIKLDGYENLYNSANIKNITEKSIDNIIDNKNYKDGLKTINNTEWYICAFIKEDLKFKKGRTKDININNQTYKGQIVDLFKDKNGMYLILKLRSDLNIFNLHRGFNGYIIKARYKGFILPKEAVVDYKGNTGVFVNTNGYVEFKKIKVIYKGENNIASNEGISSKYIQEYDKVICNPEDIRKGNIIE